MKKINIERIQKYTSAIWNIRLVPLLGGSIYIDKSLNKSLSYSWKSLVLSRVYVKKGGRIVLGNNVIIRNSHIVIDNDSVLQIGDNTIIENATLFVNGKCIIGSHNIIKDGIIWWSIENNSSLEIGDYNRLRNSLNVRFGGFLKIGNYNAINENTEIRCDENVIIGSYNGISYNVRIWDTNTHCFFKDSSEHNQYRIDHFPFFNETVRPITKSVTIGDSCWLGEYVCVLKGTTIGNHCILGFHTVISNRVIFSNSAVTNKLDYRINNIE